MQSGMAEYLEYDKKNRGRFYRLVLGMLIITILSVMFLGWALASWRETSRAWAEEDRLGLPEREGLRVESF